MRTLFFCLQLAIYVFVFSDYYLLLLVQKSYIVGIFIKTITTLLRVKLILCIPTVYPL